MIFSPAFQSNAVMSRGSADIRPAVLLVIRRYFEDEKYEYVHSVTGQEAKHDADVGTISVAASEYSSDGDFCADPNHCCISDFFQ